jgi:hypothetical protein
MLRTHYVKIIEQTGPNIMKEVGAGPDGN